MFKGINEHELFLIKYCILVLDIKGMHINTSTGK